MEVVWGGSPNFHHSYNSLVLWRVKEELILNFNRFVGVDEGVELLFLEFGMYILSSIYTAQDILTLLECIYKLYVVQILPSGIHKHVRIKSIPVAVRSLLLRCRVTNGLIEL